MFTKRDAKRHSKLSHDGHNEIRFDANVFCY